MFAAVLLLLVCGLSDEVALLGQWRSLGDGRVASESAPAIDAHSVSSRDETVAGRARRVGWFDGRRSAVEIADSRRLRFGRGDFSLTAWINAAADGDDLPGDIASKAGRFGRTGWTLALASRTGTPHSHSNERNLQFGIMSAASQPIWIDRGRPGNSVYVHAFAVHEGSLYAGTCETGAGESGHVYRLADQRDWIDCGCPDPCNSVSTLAVWRGRLYAGVAKYRLAGSALVESTNPHSGGAVYRYEGGKAWTPVGRLTGSEAVACLVEYRGELYASSLYRPAGFFKYDGKERWLPCPTPDGRRVEALCVFNGQIFAGSYDGGHVYRYDGVRWHDCGLLANNTQTYGFAVFWGELHVGTWPSGRVYRYRNDGDWADCGRLGNELEVMGMAVHNGSLYAGTLPLAEVHRYDGSSTWTRIGQVDVTPDVKYRRAWSMAVFRGQLFVGTLPSGSVRSLEVGHAVTVDRPLSNGWHHVAAVRRRNALQIFVDGKLAAESTGSQLDAIDVDNDEPMRIGFGPNDHFKGGIDDVRVYRGALDSARIADIALGRD